MKLSKAKKIIGIIQVRMNSVRLPGKVMHRVKEKPLLEYLIERIKKTSQLDEVIVATSINRGDDPINVYCENNNLKCYRGFLDDVAGRFAGALVDTKYYAFVRINGDSPLMDYRLVDKLVEIFKNNKYDIVTNCMKRSFPKGQSVEVVNRKVFLKHYEAMEDPQDLEHVTKYFYRNKDKFKICNIDSGNDNYSKVNLCVDTSSDLEIFGKLLDKLGDDYKDLEWAKVADEYKNIISQTAG